MPKSDLPDLAPPETPMTPALRWNRLWRFTNLILMLTGIVGAALALAACLHALTLGHDLYAVVLLVPFALMVALAVQSLVSFSEARSWHNRMRGH